MTIKISSIVALIIGLMTILGGLFTVGFNVYSYHNTLATKQEVDNGFLQAKKDNNMIWVDLRLADVEDSIRFYQRIGTDKLDADGRLDYADLRETRKRLRIKRNNILSLDGS